MITARLADILKTAFSQSTFFSSLTPEEALAAVKIERPRERSHGHYAVNVSPLARYLKSAPPMIANALVDAVEHLLDVKAVSVGGFVNFTLDDALFGQALTHLLTDKAPGKNTACADDAILLEYVSANPTGPLHIGHGRWAALGDSLVRVLRHCGAVVTPEFYINDAGVQMGKIAISVFLRTRELLIKAGKLPDTPLAMEYPYPGDYVCEFAADYLSQASEADVNHIMTIWQRLNGYEEPLGEENSYGLTDDDRDWVMAHVSPVAYAKALTQQKELLCQLGVEFEAWFSEKSMLYERGLVDKTLQRLKAQQFSYEQDGALWLQSSELGDEKDRVLIKSDGNNTYLAADIAYHAQKYERRDAQEQPQYSKIINIWGADHHGYIARLRASMIALGYLHGVEDPKFEIVLGQLVNLVIDGERERMGKRRKMLTLEDVVNDVGVDATRFWMVSKSPDTALDFDVNLAKSASNENPVYYVQYAHARCCSILRNALNPTQTSDKPVKPFITQDDLNQLETAPTLSHVAPLFELDPAWEDGEKTLADIRELIMMLDRLDEVVIHAASSRSPHGVARYTQDISAQFHSVYNQCRMLSDDPKLTGARLALVIAFKRVLAQALELLGVSAPESM